MRCEKCGFDFDASLTRCPKCNASVEFSGNTLFFQKAKQSHVKFKEIFSGTFKKHPSGTAAKIFAAGTPETTPAPDRMLAVWQKPWLYSRFLLAGILFLIVSYVLSQQLNSGMLAIIGTFGTLVIPFAILMFIWEMNIPRDISFIKVIFYFIVGGIISLVFTYLFGIAFGEYEAPYAAFTEEPAKLLITLIFMHKAKTKYGFGGMLIGASVGAGFTVFENVCYVFNNFLVTEATYSLQDGIEAAWTVFLIRSLTAIGTHTMWAAIEGAAAALGRKGKSTGFGYLVSPLFWGCFAASILLHFSWNGGLSLVFDSDDTVVGSLFRMLVLCIIAVSLMFLLTNKCLKQAVKAYDDSRSDVMNRSPAYAAAYAPAAPAPAIAFPQNVPQAAPIPPYVPANPFNAPAEHANQYPAPEQNRPVYANPNIAAANTPAKPAAPVIKCAALNLEKPIDKILNIGRDASYCDIVFPPDTAGVSRRHCAVMVSPERVIYVMDLGSSVGTFLPGGSRIAPNEWTVIDGEFFVATEKYAFTIA